MYYGINKWAYILSRELHSERGGGGGGGGGGGLFMVQDFVQSRESQIQSMLF